MNTEFSIYIYIYNKSKKKRQKKKKYHSHLFSYKILTFFNNTNTQIPRPLFTPLNCIKHFQRYDYIQYKRLISILHYNLIKQNMKQ